MRCKLLIMSVFHNVPGVPRAKVERWNALPAWIHKLALLLIQSYGCTRLEKWFGVPDVLKLNLCLVLLNSIEKNKSTPPVAFYNSLYLTAEINKKEMKKIKIIFLAIALAALCINVFGQEKNKAFQVSISGKGKQAILFIPGFACSGDVWKETQAALKGDYTFYTFTMAGFAGAPAQASQHLKAGKMQ
ncbi:MAG: Peptidase family S33-like protein [Mucilaginibacter sp.]|nr:Peptidase family S33-like protein [Mucilaginibacter sp.]